jgi:hypothetical protein
MPHEGIHVRMDRSSLERKCEKIPYDKIRALVARMVAINTIIKEYKGGNKFYR